MTPPLLAVPPKAPTRRLSEGTHREPTVLRGVWYARGQCRREPLRELLRPERTTAASHSPAAAPDASLSAPADRRTERQIRRCSRSPATRRCAYPSPSREVDRPAGTATRRARLARPPARPVRRRGARVVVANSVATANHRADHRLRARSPAARGEPSATRGPASRLPATVPTAITASSTPAAAAMPLLGRGRRDRDVQRAERRRRRQQGDEHEPQRGRDRAPCEPAPARTARPARRAAPARRDRPHEQPDGADAQRAAAASRPAPAARRSAARRSAPPPRPPQSSA